MPAAFPARRRPGRPPSRTRRIARWATPLAVAYAAVRGVEGARRPLPPGLNVAVPPAPVADVTFLADTTALASVPWEASPGVPRPNELVDGRERVIDQQIFDAVFELIGNARQGVLIDMFLYNAWQGAHPERTRPLAGELTQTLVDKRASDPDVGIVLITDPINTVYGSVSSPELDALRAAGVTVVVTDLARLPDSNPLWSGPWRAFVQPFGRGGRGWLPNPFAPDGPRVTARGWLELLNFKANHRKVALADTPEGPAAIVTSANPHDGSSAHGNVALRVRGPVVGAIAASERAVAALSGVALPPLTWAGETAAGGDGPEGTSTAPRGGTTAPPVAGEVRVGLATEAAIQTAVLDALGRASAGDAVDVAMFYLSDRDVVGALRAAAGRGAAVRALLDPNKDAFGRTKNGVPNRPVAAELRRAGVDVRWCATHGEQCHAKLVLVRGGRAAASTVADRRGSTSPVTATLILGSANLTRRNIDGLNLETDLVVTAPPDAPVMLDAADYFERVWDVWDAAAGASDGRDFSVAYDAYDDDAWPKRWLYRFMEATGVSTF